MKVKKLEPNLELFGSLVTLVNSLENIFVGEKRHSLAVVAWKVS